MRSAETRGIPAAIAPRTAALAPAASWRRPRKRRRSSVSDCTPIERRFTPASRSARARSSSSEVGLHSTVTSIDSPVAPSCWRTPSSTRPSSRGSHRLGVPPPKKMLSTRRPAKAGVRDVDLAEDGVGVAGVVDARGVT